MAELSPEDLQFLAALDKPLSAFALAAVLDSDPQSPFNITDTDTLRARLEGYAKRGLVVNIGEQPDGEAIAEAVAAHSDVPDLPQQPGARIADVYSARARRFLVGDVYALTYAAREALG